LMRPAQVGSVSTTSSPGSRIDSSTRTRRATRGYP
jgi:hypothetical protein